MTDPRRPQPVLDAATQLGKLFAAAVLAVGLLWFAIAEGITRDSLGTVAALAGGALTALVAFGAFVWSKVVGRRAAAKVTPTEDPRDDRGVPLVPVDEYGAHAAAPGDGRPSPADLGADLDDDAR